MKTYTTIILAGACAAVGLGIAVYLAVTISDPLQPVERHASAPAPRVDQSTAAPAAPLAPAQRSATQALETAAGQSGGALAAPPASIGLNARETNFAPLTTAADPPDVSPAEKTVAWRKPQSEPANRSAPAGVENPSDTTPAAVEFRSRSPSPHQAVEVQLRPATAGRSDGRTGGIMTGQTEAAADSEGAIAVRFRAPAGGLPADGLQARATPRPASIRSPVGPDDSTLLRRSVEEFRSLRRPLDHVGTRYYSPRYLTIEHLQTLIEPLLSDKTGSAQRTWFDRPGGQRAPMGEGQPVLAIRDRLETLDRLDRIVPLLDMAPTYVSLEGMVLDIRLSGSATVDFQRLIQKRYLVPAEHSRRELAKAVGSPDGNGLKVAYLNGDVNGLLEALGASGVATLVGTPRVAVRQGAEAEIDLDPAGAAGDRSPQDDKPAKPRAGMAVRLFLRAVAVYEGGMDVEVKVVPAPGVGTPDPRDRPAVRAPETDLPRLRQESLSVVVPDGVMLVIGGLAYSGSTPESPADKPAFLGIKTFRSRSGAGRHELLVLVTPRYEGPSPAEAAKAIEALGAGPRRTVAQQYLRAAQRAYAASQQGLALQWAEQALRFDASDPAAVELYERLQKTASAAARTSWR